VLPERPEAGEVLVRVLTVGLCGTDLHAYCGNQPFFTYPRILGHELAVEVMECGDGVSAFKPGDRCAVNPYMACGDCPPCREGRTNCCITMKCLGVHMDGGMRERIVLPASHLYRSEKLGDVELALVETLGVGAHAVGRSRVQKGEPALVIGAGPIGLSVLEFLRVEGADAGVIERNPRRLRFAADKHGLSRYYPSHQEARQDEPATLVFDCTGDKPSMDDAVQLVRHGGRLVFVGLINDHFSIFDPEFHRREITLLASRNANPHEHRRVMALLESGDIDIRSWPADIIAPSAISARFPYWIDKNAGTVKGIVNFT
jgi:hypothetical protein